MTRKSSVALYNKYRPKAWQDLTEQDAVKQILSNELQTGNIKRVLLFTGGAGTGKAQPLYSKILTPSGFITMGDVQIGTEVFTASGSVAKVSEIYPQGKRDIFEITLQDNSKIRVADNHLNCVYRYNQRKHVREDFIWETIKLAAEFKNQKYKLRMDIPFVDFSQQEILINPYLLGALIGDGNLTNFSFSNSEQDVLDKISNILEKDYGMYLNPSNKYDYNIRYIENPKHNGSKGNKGLHNLQRNYEILKTLKGQLDFYNLRCKSVEKHIPKQYLYNTKEIRLELLRGLYDTDGWKGGRCFSTSSKQLAEDFLFLVRSLGIRATLTTSIGGYSGIQCHEHFTIHLKPPKDMRIFSSKKHIENYLPQQQEPMRNIKSIEYIGREECQCIMVDHPDHTYISDDFVPTHNTTSARIYANEIEPNASNIIEINCADHTGVDDVRTLIIDASRSKPLSGKYKVFVLDECFVGGTMISTPEGNYPIENIKPNQIVNTMIGPKKVLNTLNHQIPIDRLVIVTINGKSTLTTKDHLFFTSEGWIEAQYLKEGDIVYGTQTLKKNMENMSKLFEDFSGLYGKGFQDLLLPAMSQGIPRTKKTAKSETNQINYLCSLWQTSRSAKDFHSKNLLSEMSPSINKSDRTSIHAFAPRSTRCTSKSTKNASFESHVSTSLCTEKHTDQNEQWQFTPMERQTWRKWYIHKGTAPVEASIRRGLGTRISCKNWATEKDLSMAYQLQIRPCLSRENAGDRGGWQMPSLEKWFVKRCQERGMSGSFKVEAVEIYQPTNSRRFVECGLTNTELSNGYITMYDLEIEGHPSYFANDVLVHNCHMLTVQSQNALLKILEEPPAHCVYILCTTDPQKVLGTIMSRAFRYDFQLISHKGIVDRLNYVLEQEKQDPEGCGVESWNQDAIHMIATLAGGHMRNALATLDKIISFTKTITVKDVEKISGASDYGILFDVLDCLLAKQQAELLNKINEISSSGMDLKLFIKNFLSFVLDVNKYVILKTEVPNKDPLQMITIPSSYMNRLINYNVSHKAQLKSILRLLIELNSSIRWETNVKPVLETNLLLEVL